MRKILKRGIIILAGIGVVGAVVVFGINQYVKSATADRIFTEQECVEMVASGDFDCILVLGAGVWGNDTPSPMLNDRLEQGIALYEAGVAPKLLMSGDHGRENYDEVNVMKDFAIDAGVPSEDIFMDHAGFSTYESLYRAKEIFQAKKIIIVTQGYHLYRALYLAENLGIEAYGVASDPRAYSGQFMREIREILARDKDFVTAIFKPEPTYLGEAIPVSGDGNVTNDK